MKIIIDDLNSSEVISLLAEHLNDMYATSPAESVHALDVESLKTSDITFFSAWFGASLAGCIAIKTISNNEAEIKSMRTSKNFRGQGVASELVRFIIIFAKEAGYETLKLETGTQEYFAPARNLYKKFGFIETGPFGPYKTDPNSCFFSLPL